MEFTNSEYTNKFYSLFIGGYFLQLFYAAIGAAVDNQTDSQQFLLPIIMPLVLSVYVGFFSVMNDPHGTLVVVFSMIPLIAYCYADENCLVYLCGKLPFL
jgi:ABC-type Na+ efflux pump permease subunit